jgi:predicted ATP-dependent protease
VLYDNDPSLQSLFGGIEGASEASNIPDFMRLRAGNLMRADGGTLLLHLRDILADEQNGTHILEKLHRFLRNGTLQIEDLSSSGNQGSSLISAQAAIPVSVKIVLIATREDYYELLSVKPDFFDFFPIKIEFADQVKASPENYAAYASFIAHKCRQHHCRHFTSNAVAVLLQAMHRLIEDQTRLSTKFAVLEKLLLESAAAANLRGAELVEVEDVKSAIQRKYARHSYIEAHMRDSIVDKELIISVHGECIGQINGLTHIDLSEASFGSPVRISANCYPGSRGVLTIDREVRMSGPTHDKGVMILQSWLHANFSHLNPLNLTASLVFEQEYSGVDGDSASCAELFALLSSLAQVPIKQGIAVTGALNQHGEVLPIGGLNEKIEGYFRVCKEIGLDGKQGVLMPERNMRHLMLSDEVIQAVAQGQFHIATMNNVADGIHYLTGHPLQSVNIMAEVVLKDFKTILETNTPKRPS